MIRTTLLLVASRLVARPALPLGSAENARRRSGRTRSAPRSKRRNLRRLARRSTPPSRSRRRVAMAYPERWLILHYQGFAHLSSRPIRAMADGSDATRDLPARADDSRASRSRRVRCPRRTCLLSSIDGQLIAKDPSRAMELGMASQASTSAALDCGPNNPRVWLLRGQGAIFTPPEYGGGLDAAEEQLKRAIELFAKDAPKPGEPSWGKAEAYLWLGQVYEKTGRQGEGRGDVQEGARRRAELRVREEARGCAQVGAHG